VLRQGSNSEDAGDGRLLRVQVEHLAHDLPLAFDLDQREEVGEAVTEMDQVTQQNAGLVQESARSANNLRENAHKLIDSMSAFKLPHSGREDALALAGLPTPSSKAPAKPRPTSTQQQQEPEWESF